MTDVRCIECAKFSLKDDPANALFGRGKCADEKIKSVRYDALRKKPCKGFAPAVEQIVDAREDWFRKNGIV